MTLLLVAALHTATLMPACLASSIRRITPGRASASDPVQNPEQDIKSVMASGIEQGEVSTVNVGFAEASVMPKLPFTCMHQPHTGSLDCEYPVMQV